MNDIQWQEDFKQFCQTQFGVSPDIVFEALLQSPNARGYILGSLSELLLKNQIESLGFSVKRIKEKWVGEKKHHGDFYVSRDGSNWYILESKGLKSNSAKWHKSVAVERDYDALKKWFNRKNAGEFKLWWNRLNNDQQELILRANAFHKAKIVETHFVSGRSKKTGRIIATPRISEFDIVAVDLFLQTGHHEFVYAASSELPPSTQYPDHLKQNYLIDIIVPTVNRNPQLVPPWTQDFSGLFNRLKAKPVNIAEMQADERRPGEREGQLLEFDIADIDELD